MTTIMEVNMPGYRWLTVHGYGEQSAFYAVAAGLASGPDIPRPLDWSEGTPEREIFNFLEHSWDSGSDSYIANVFEPSIYYQLDLMIRSWNGSRQEKQYSLVLQKHSLTTLRTVEKLKEDLEKLQKQYSTMLRTVEKLKEDLEKLPSPAPASLTATMEVLLAALKLAAVAEDKETTA
ncbi:hypothetical protein D6C95_10012 [Aureobasidium pullulans]|nr:hypothetical protein D6C95_10012 [Aureobasidium pullulans]